MRERTGRQDRAEPQNFRLSFALLATTILERGVQARSELGDFLGAIELCDRAIALDLGAHWEAKRESLDWAR